MPVNTARFIHMTLLPDHFLFQAPPVKRKLAGVDRDDTDSIASDSGDICDSFLSSTAKSARGRVQHNTRRNRTKT